MTPQGSKALDYKPELWADREFFKFEVRAPLVQTILSFEVHKFPGGQTQVSASIALKLPFRKELSYRIETHIPRTNEFSFSGFLYLSEEMSDKGWKRVTQPNVMGFQIETRDSAEKESSITEIKLPFAEPLPILNALMIPLVLRANVPSPASTCISQILVSRRLYALEIQNGESVLPPVNSWPGFSKINPVHLHLLVREKDRSDLKEAKGGELIWDTFNGVPLEIRVPAPIIGRVSLRLLEYQKSQI